MFYNIETGIIFKPKNLLVVVFHYFYFFET